MSEIHTDQTLPLCSPDQTRRPDPHFRVTAIDKARAFLHYRKLGSNYQEAVSWGPAKHLRAKERGAVLELSLFEPGKRMLDMGTGSGFYALQAKKRGMQVTAVDLVPEMVTCLDGHVDETIISDVESFQHPARFDSVVCAGVLDFVLQPEIAFERLCRLVAPNGRLVILVPRTGIGGWIYRMEKRLHGISINLFEESWLVEQASKAGLRHLETRKPLPNNIVVSFCRPV